MDQKFIAPRFNWQSFAVAYNYSLLCVIVSYGVVLSVILWHKAKLEKVSVKEMSLLVVVNSEPVCNDYYCVE
jgi:hypothetical protein